MRKEQLYGTKKFVKGTIMEMERKVAVENNRTQENDRNGDKDLTRSKTNDMRPADEKAYTRNEQEFVRTFSMEIEHADPRV